MQPPPPKVWAKAWLQKREVAWKRELIKNVRDNRLSAPMRKFLANELQCIWFPTSAAAKADKANKRLAVRQWYARVYRVMIDYVARTEHISKAEAKVKIVQEYNLQSVESLEQFMKRMRRERRGSKR